MGHGLSPRPEPGHSWCWFCPKPLGLSLPCCWVPKVRHMGASRSVVAAFAWGLRAILGKPHVVPGSDSCPLMGQRARLLFRDLWAEGGQKGQWGEIPSEVGEQDPVTKSRLSAGEGF